MSSITVNHAQAVELKKFQASEVPAVIVRDMVTGTPILVAHGADEGGVPVAGYVALNGHGYEVEALIPTFKGLSEEDRKSLRWVGCYSGLSSRGWDPGWVGPISFMVHQDYEDPEVWRISVIHWELNE